MTIIWQILLGIYVLTLVYMFHIISGTSSLKDFRYIRINYTYHLAYIIISAILIVSAFMIDTLESYRYRISTLIVFISPVIMSQLTLHAKTKCMDKDTDEYIKIKSASRSVDRIATFGYIIYIAFTLTYLCALPC